MHSKQQMRSLQDFDPAAPCCVLCPCAHWLQAAAEQSARVDAQERLNMQYFKSHLLADMLVAKLLDLEAAGVAAPPAAAAAAGAAAVVQIKQQPAAAQKVALAGAPQQQQVVMAESSFD